MLPLPDRLPLVIGVTGHRDLRDEHVARLEVEVANVIERLRLDYLDPDGETRSSFCPPWRKAPIAWWRGWR
jgi:hypothetical protein